MMKKLSKNITIEQFDNGYWYAKELKKFAKQLGVSYTSKLRKDELETIIRNYLKTDKIAESPARNLSTPKIKDTDVGLSLTLPVINYADTRETKDFIMAEALKLEPGLKRKSGAQYRLNRWRERKVASNTGITYRDVVLKFIELNQKKGKFKQAQSGRYINFLSDFLKNETNASRREAIKVWHRLKDLDIPKSYEAWKKFSEEDSSSR